MRLASFLMEIPFFANTFSLGLLAEAEFYNIPGLVALCKEKLELKPHQQKCDEKIAVSF